MFCLSKNQIIDKFTVLVNPNDNCNCITPYFFLEINLNIDNLKTELDAHMDINGVLRRVASFFKCSKHEIISKLHKCTKLRDFKLKIKQCNIDKQRKAQQHLWLGLYFAAIKLCQKSKDGYYLLSCKSR